MRFLPFLIGFSLIMAPGLALAQQPVAVPSTDSIQQPAPQPVCASLVGLVTDENYQSLLGATVQVQGINDAFSTNAEGRYIVALKSALPRPIRLKVSAAGYETQEFALSGCQPPDVALHLVPGTRFKRDGRIKKTTSTGKIKY